jgi:hypothetical protein
VIALKGQPLAVGAPVRLGIIATKGELPDVFQVSFCHRGSSSSLCRILCKKAEIKQQESENKRESHKQFFNSGRKITGSPHVLSQGKVTFDGDVHTMFE